MTVSIVAISIQTVVVTSIARKQTKTKIKGFVIDSNNAIAVECYYELQPCHTFLIMSAFGK